MFLMKVIKEELEHVWDLINKEENLQWEALG